MPTTTDARGAGARESDAGREPRPGEDEPGYAFSGFEHLLMRISARLSGARWQEVNTEVDRALGEILAFCGADHLGIFEVLPGAHDACLRHVATAPGLPLPPLQFSYARAFPSAYDRSVTSAEVLAVYQADDLAPDARDDTQALRDLGLGAMLHVPLRIDGEVRFILIAGRARRDTDWPDAWGGRLAALGAICAHALLRASAHAGAEAGEHDMRQMLAVAHIARWEWDIGADKLHLSPEAKHILGSDVPDFSALQALVMPEDRAALVRSLDQARSAPGRRFGVRYLMATPAGEVRAIQQWHELVFPGQRTARLLATVQDMTALLEHEQALNELRLRQWHSARLSQASLLVASLAHELSQPLTAILNNAQAGLRFLNGAQLDRAEMREIFEDIVASDRRAGDVLAALRTMLRRQETARATFDAADAARDVLALVRSELLVAQVKVQAALEAGCLIDADRTQIEQVLLNLAMNALDAMREKAQPARLLHIAVFRDRGDVHIAVRDSGAGIPADSLPKVFDAFWTTKTQGLGMGLPVSRAIVESHGGRIWCEANDTGGATFHVTLPAARAPEQPPAAGRDEGSHERRHR